MCLQACDTHVDSKREVLYQLCKWRISFLQDLLKIQIKKKVFVFIHTFPLNIETWRLKTCLSKFLLIKICLVEFRKPNCY